MERTVKLVLRLSWILISWYSKVEICWSYIIGVMIKRSWYITAMPPPLSSSRFVKGILWVGGTGWSRMGAWWFWIQVSVRNTKSSLSSSMMSYICEQCATADLTFIEAALKCIRLGVHVLVLTSLMVRALDLVFMALWTIRLVELSESRACGTSTVVQLELIISGLIMGRELWIPLCLMRLKAEVLRDSVFDQCRRRLWDEYTIGFILKTDDD